MDQHDENQKQDDGNRDSQPFPLSQQQESFVHFSRRLTAVRELHMIINRVALGIRFVDSAHDVHHRQRGKEIGNPHFDDKKRIEQADNGPDRQRHD
ncbi:hypothetical protein D3C76_1494580 [compost metagenome]